ncbi:MAG: hypothetical protein VR72_12110 [Clostridiaceae bacterium BRH_c20a]|nr:MAG: hypothetical protein VR72_12110 [Clostridiaceae bacterium BRH_c20a]
MQTIIIGIAGTAKNTGKTTTTSSIMSEVKDNKKLSLGLTSIGYDGEDIDNVTGLPKPRIEVWPGVLVAVAEKCLKVSTAEVEVLEVTKFATPLGKVILGKVTKGGRLVVAGPNKSSELRQVLNKLRHHNLNLIIVDGALNRIAPMVEVDGLILTTGAARKSKISELAFETHCLVEVFNYPVLNIEHDTFRFNSILSSDAVDELLRQLETAGTVYINGVIGEKSLMYLLEKAEKLSGKKLIFPDPIKLMVIGDINKIHNIFAQLKHKGIEIGVRKPIKIIALTINPYYPKYRFNSDDYEVSYVDKEKLYEAIAGKVSVNVYNVVEEGGKMLFNDILNYKNNT